MVIRLIEVNQQLTDALVFIIILSIFVCFILITSIAIAMSSNSVIVSFLMSRYLLIHFYLSATDRLYLYNCTCTIRKKTINVIKMKKYMS